MVKSLHCVEGGHEIDLENGVIEACAAGSLPEVEELSVDRVERDCRICHLSLVSEEKELGVPIELGCSCKEDLAAAHRHCAEAWFKIKGNKTCEICGSVAQNIVTIGETEVTQQSTEATTSTAVLAASTETVRFWQGHRLLNLLLACMVFAFVISWLFRFNVQT